MRKYLWMAVEADDLELPLAIAETATELGEMIGVNHKTIRSCFCKQYSGKKTGMRFMKVKVDDELVE